MERVDDKKRKAEIKGEGIETKRKIKIVEIRNVVEVVVEGKGVGWEIEKSRKTAKRRDVFKRRRERKRKRWTIEAEIQGTKIGDERSRETKVESARWTAKAKRIIALRWNESKNTAKRKKNEWEAKREIERTKVGDVESIEIEIEIVFFEAKAEIKWIQKGDRFTIIEISPIVLTTLAL